MSDPVGKWYHYLPGDPCNKVDLKDYTDMYGVGLQIEYLFMRSIRFGGSLERDPVGHLRPTD